MNGNTGRKYGKADEAWGPLRFVEDVAGDKLKIECGHIVGVSKMGFVGRRRRCPVCRDEQAKK